MLTLQLSLSLHDRKNVKEIVFFVVSKINYFSFSFIEALDSRVIILNKLKRYLIFPSHPTLQ